jgi:hypothetical protein
MSIWSVAHGLDELEHELTLQVLETELDDEALFLQSRENVSFICSPNSRDGAANSVPRGS